MRSTTVLKWQGKKVVIKDEEREQNSNKRRQMKPV